MSNPPVLLLGRDSRRSQVKEVTLARSAKEAEPREVHHGHKSPSPGSPAPPPTSTADCPPLDVCTLWLTCLGFLFFLPGCPNGPGQVHFTIGALRLERRQGHQLISLPPAKRGLTPGHSQLLPSTPSSRTLNSEFFALLDFSSVFMVCLPPMNPYLHLILSLLENKTNKSHLQANLQPQPNFQFLNLLTPFLNLRFVATALTISKASSHSVPKLLTNLANPA